MRQREHSGISNMFLHIGNGKLIKKDRIIGIFDFDTATVAAKTKKWLSEKQKEKKIISVNYELPKSFILMDKSDGSKIYLSQLSPKTLVSRTDKIGINKIN